MGKSAQRQGRPDHAATGPPASSKTPLAAKPPAQPSLEELRAALPRAERIFLEAVTLDARDACAWDPDKAAATLRASHCCVLRGALEEADVAAITREYETHQRVRAIGEKAADKRSGTRFFNCACQRGPRCGFEGWRPTARAARRALAGGVVHDARHERRAGKLFARPPRAPWRAVVAALGFDHVARVEVVTGHAGARAQDWHVDGDVGVTVILALADVDLAKGPTQLDLSTPFAGFDGRRVKVATTASRASGPGGKASASSSTSSKPSGGGGDESFPSTVHAGTLARGDCLIMNCNVLHRGTANLTKVDRPILVLDCSPRCGASDAGFYPAEHYPCAGDDDDVLPQ